MLRVAIAGDLHGQWDDHDEAVLRRLQPDALLLVGDLADGDGRLGRRLASLPLPAACILGNHDAGRDASGRTMARMDQALGDLHCPWSLRWLDPPGLAVVGGRPGSAGGGFNLSQAVQAHWGPLDLLQSAERISTAALAAPEGRPLVLLAHCGPSGLGSAASDPCGRDWKRPALDWGDLDLREALQRIRRQRPVPLVVFGHMHHRLRSGGSRRRLLRDGQGTIFFNAACVPRHGHDDGGRPVRQFSWVDLNDAGGVEAVRLCWHDSEGVVRAQDDLLSSEPVAC